MTLTFGSLFAGIGGMDLGLERAGMQCKWQVEIDPYAQKVLAKHWPGVDRFSDVRGIHPEWACPLRRRGIVADRCSWCAGPVDVICGGFPCQDISNAGARAGLAGSRSGLWFRFRRLIGLFRPRFVLVENVAALLVRGLGTVLGDLASSGYDAEWDCIPAAAVGAPHRRDRLFLVAYADGEPRWIQSVRESGCGGSAEPRHDGTQRSLADAVRIDGGQGRARGSASGRARQPVAVGPLPNADAPDSNGLRQLQPQGRIFDERGWLGDGGWWAAEPDVGRVAYGVPSGVDRLKGLGNAVVPQVAEFIGRRIVAHAEAA